MTQSPAKRPALREESVEAIGGVLGLLTHDLRNPLAALSSNVGFLNMVGEAFSQEVVEALQDIQLSIEALARIVDSLELVAHDLDTFTPPPQFAVRVAGILRVVLPPIERAAQSHGVALLVNMNGYDDARLFIGETYFCKALAALLLNAITSAPSRTTVALDVIAEEADLLFRVVDQGEALDPAFTQAAVSATGQVEIKTEKAGRYSRGLGLYVVARSAELASARLRIGATGIGSTIDLVCSQAP